MPTGGQTWGFESLKEKGVGLQDPGDLLLHARDVLSREAFTRCVVALVAGQEDAEWCLVPPLVA